LILSFIKAFFYYNLKAKTNKTKKGFKMKMSKKEVRTTSSRYYSIKRLEQIENNESKVISTYSEIAEVAIQQMKKLKEPAMINMLIDLLPEGTKKELLFLILQSNKKNIVIDTSSLEETVPKHLSKEWDTTEEAVRVAIRFFVGIKWIKRLNKYQYMANPYYIVDNGISTKRISQLQAYWNIPDISNQIVWEQDNTDELFKENLTQTIENVNIRQKEILKYKKLKTQQINDDTITIQNNLQKFKTVFTSFLEYNKYSEINTNVKVHFRAWLIKAYKNNYHQVDELPELYLTSLKPINLLIDKE